VPASVKFQAGILLHALAHIFSTYDFYPKFDLENEQISNAARLRSRFGGVLEEQVSNLVA
jgi:hypothetical protein